MAAKRKYFGTDGVRGEVGASLINPEFVMKLGWAVGKVLANGERRKVLIGKDTRVSGYMLESALEAGLSAAGVDILLLGPMPTPGIAYLTRTLRANAGIVISASHNPFHDNGIKFFSAEGRKLPDEIELAIEKQLDNKMVTVKSSELGKAERIDDASGRFIEFCKSTIPSSTRLSGLKVIVDCANGATYHIAPSVFRELGAEVIEVAVEPDGFNINDDCGSTKPEKLQQRVLQEKADLGIALDGDGDRVMMVDHRGELLDGDDLLFIIANELFAEGRLHGGVVGTVMTNFGLQQAFEQAGIEFVRSQVGDRYVLEELDRRQWLLGGESSGHIICLDKTSTGDGIVAALQVLYSMTKRQVNLHELKQGLTKSPQTMVNVKCHDGEKVLADPSIQDAVADTEKSLNGNGRVLLRCSGTEPLIRVMVEGNQDNVAELAQNLAGLIEQRSKAVA